MKVPQYVLPSITVATVLNGKNVRWSNYDERILSISDEEWTSIKEAAIKADDHNRKVRATLEKIFAVGRKMITAVYGYNHNVSKYLEKQHMPFYHPQHHFSNYETSYRNYKEAKEKIEETKRQKTVENNKNKLVEEAVNWLLTKGKTLGSDFTLSNAIEYANEIAFEEEKQRLIAIGELFEFCGNDNCESCHGWDGISHRCSCGNRRVSWVSGDGHSFKSPYIYAEAW